MHFEEINGVPEDEVGFVVQDFVDAGAIQVEAREEPGGTTFTIRAGFVD